MADNTTINAGSGGDVIATDDLTTLNGGAVSGFKAQRVKVGHGVDGTFTDVTAASGLPVVVSPASERTTGTVTTSTSAVTATFSNRSTATIDVSGTYAGVTFVFEGSVDGTNWFMVADRAMTGSYTAANTARAPGANASTAYSVDVTNFTGVRLRALAWTSGTMNVGITTTSNAGLVTLPFQTDSAGRLNMNISQIGGSTATSAAGLPVASVVDSRTTGTVTTSSSTVPFTLAGRSTAMIDYSGTYGGVAFVEEGSVDGGTTYVGIQARNTATWATSSAWSPANSTQAFLVVDVAGLSQVRVRATAWLSGTMTVGISATTAPAATSTSLAQGVGVRGLAAVGNPVLVAGWDNTNVQTISTDSTGKVNVSLNNWFGGTLTAAATIADTVANPGVPWVGADLMAYNGSTWDRFRSNVNVTIADTGTKTTTFNGATVTNFNATTAYITVLCGTVSGTTPTMTIQLQWSPDGGTSNWLNLGPATTAITATGNTATIIIGPMNWSQTPGSTPSALTTGATTTTAITASLPRNYRLVYTIGGTTPSFAITSVFVNYVL